MTQAEATRIWTAWLAAFRADSLKGIDAAKRHFADSYVEFHTIWPVLLKGRELFHAFDGARYADPLHATKIGDRPAAGPRDQIVRPFGQSILVVSASQSARLEPDGTISYHLNRQTWVLVLIGGAWLMAAGHNSPPAAEEGPYGHNQFAGGQLRHG